MSASCLHEAVLLISFRGLSPLGCSPLGGNALTFVSQEKQRKRNRVDKGIETASAGVVCSYALVRRGTERRAVALLPCFFPRVREDGFFGAALGTSLRLCAIAYIICFYIRKDQDNGNALVCDPLL